MEAALKASEAKAAALTAVIAAQADVDSASAAFAKSPDDHAALADLDKAEAALAAARAAAGLPDAK